MGSDFTITLIVRAILTLSFLAAGILALIMGYRLYVKGVGLAPDGTTVNADVSKQKINVSLKTVGSVVMATSIGWGALAYLSRPIIDAKKNGNDYSFTASSTNAPPGR